MWYTPEGVRRLEGCERKLVARAVVDVHDRLTRSFRRGKRTSFGIRAFDRLPPQTQPDLVLLVGESLLGNGPFPEYFSWNEAIVFILFLEVEWRVRQEVAAQKTRGSVADAICTWRPLVLKAYRETYGGPHVFDGEPPQEGDSTDMEEWSLKTVLLADLILWDRDFLDEDFFLDAPPTVADSLKNCLGIEPDYYTGVPPILSDRDCRRLASFYVTLREESKPMAA